MKRLMKCDVVQELQAGECLSGIMEREVVAIKMGEGVKHISRLEISKEQACDQRM